MSDAETTREGDSVPPTSEAKAPAPGATASPTVEPKQKIDILLKHAGDAPIMKKKKWAVERSKQVAWIIEFIRKYIKCQPQDSLFLYVNQSFAPAPDVDVGTLYESFGSDGKLVLHYCKSEAWG